MAGELMVFSLCMKSDTFFGLKLAFFVFSATEQTSVNLQRNTSVQEAALTCAELAVSYLRRSRSDRSFDVFYSSAEQEADQYKQKPCLPRYRQPPKRIDVGSAPHAFETHEVYYKSHYYYALDLTIEEMC